MCAARCVVRFHQSLQGLFHDVVQPGQDDADNDRLDNEASVSLYVVLRGLAF